MLGEEMEPYTNKNGYKANIGTFYVDGGNGGVALERVVSETGACNVIFYRSTKRVLYDKVHAMIRGVEVARAFENQL